VSRTLSLLLSSSASSGFINKDNHVTSSPVAQKRAETLRTKPRKQYLLLHTVLVATSTSRAFLLVFLRIAPIDEIY
jgi:hypothetical protein